MAKYIDLKNNEDYTPLIEPAKCINGGGLVLFPTETVYGIGADGLNEEAVKKIYKAKNRQSDNPLILHISSINMLDKIARDIGETQYKLMNKFWPGPLTIIFKKKEIVPDVVTGGLDTVAVRMPSNEVALKLIEYAGTPIAAPSANISGKPSGTCIADIYDELNDKMDYIVDGGPCSVGIESTVVCIEGEKVKILRPGKITKEQIEEIALVVTLDEHIFGKIKEGQKVLSPGMKYRHYAPTTKAVLVYSEDSNKMVNKINEIAKAYDKVTVICSNENMSKYSLENIIGYGSRDKLDEISSNIFTLLRRADKLNSDLIIIEGVSKEGMGLAIMNRLIRACSNEYILV